MNATNPTTYQAATSQRTVGEVNTGDKYTPAWLDEKGNRLIFPNENALFESSGESLAFQVANCSGFLLVGLRADGTAKLKNRDGELVITHTDCKYSVWDALCIAGPIFDAAS